MTIIIIINLLFYALCTTSLYNNKYLQLILAFRDCFYEIINVLYTSLFTLQIRISFGFMHILLAHLHVHHNHPLKTMRIRTALFDFSLRCGT